jgi:metallo-beta-lactamase class B
MTTCCPLRSAFLGAVALLVPAVLAAQRPDPNTAAYPDSLCPSCGVWNAPQRPFRIHGNTYYVGTRGLAALLVTGGEGHVLIDGGLPNTAPIILENVRALGFAATDIKLILNSHPHYDHAGGIRALQLASGARVVLSDASASAVEHGKAARDDPQQAIAFDFPAVPEVTRVAHGETVRVGSLTLTAYLTAGHAPGGTTWSWQSCESSRCVTLVYADSQTPVSADGFRFTGSSAATAFERGFALLEGLRCDLLITPHPGASAFWERVEAGQAKLLDAEGCKRYAAAGRQRLARRLEAEAARPDEQLRLRREPSPRQTQVR